MYSFGILLMEIITGKSPVDYSRPPGYVLVRSMVPLRESDPNSCMRAMNEYENLKCVLC